MTPCLSVESGIVQKLKNQRKNLTSLFVFISSVNSRSSSSSKYDPEILKAEIATAKSRVRASSSVSTT